MKKRFLTCRQFVWMRHQCVYLYFVGLFDEVNLLLHFVTPTYILSTGASQNVTHVSWNRLPNTSWFSIGNLQSVFLYFSSLSQWPLSLRCSVSFLLRHCWNTRFTLSSKKNKLVLWISPGLWETKGGEHLVDFGLILPHSRNNKWSEAVATRPDTWSQG